MTTRLAGVGRGWLAGVNVSAELPDIVSALREARARAAQTFGARGCDPMPSREALVSIVAGLRAVLFPNHFGPGDLRGPAVDFFVGHVLDTTLQALAEQVRRGLCFGEPIGDSVALTRRAGELVRELGGRLPAIHDLLETDIQAAYDGDPAAKSRDEVLFCYPGITAMIHYRIAHTLHELGVPVLARIVSELAHAETGIDLHPGASIGASFFIDHGTGVVIGETARIGQRVRLYQGVTLGAKSFPLDERGAPIKGRDRHPIVEDDVVIYAGATILGRVTIGRGSSIGGNVWLTRSVPPGSRITQAQVRSDDFEGGGGI